MRLLIFILLFTTSLKAQNNRFLFCVGANYSPTIKVLKSGDLSINKTTYSPQLELSLGVSGFEGFARLGNVTSLGFRAGNNFLMSGLSYTYSPFANDSYRHSVYLELYYYKKVFKNAYLLLYTRHGVTLKDSKYLFSPINIGLTFKLN